MRPRRRERAARNYPGGHTGRPADAAELTLREILRDASGSAAIGWRWEVWSSSLMGVSGESVVAAVSSGLWLETLGEV